MASILGAGAAVALLAACNPGSLISMAGNGSAGNAGDTEPALAATLSDPGSVAAIPTGGFYVVDHSACVIRKIDGANVITTVAGNGTCGSSGNDGPATAAEISPTSPDSKSFQSIAVTPDGTLYFADVASSTVRKISNGTISLAGQGSSVTGVVTGPDGNVYVNENGTIGRVEANGTISEVASMSSVTAVSAIAVIDSTHFLVALGDGTSQSIVSVEVVGPNSTGASTLINYGGEINAMTIGSDGNIYLASEGDGGIARVQADGSSYNFIAGNGSADPANSAQHGVANDLALTPRGIAMTPNHGLLFSSGHVTYRLEDPVNAPVYVDSGSTTTTGGDTTTTTIGQT